MLPVSIKSEYVLLSQDKIEYKKTIVTIFFHIVEKFIFKLTLTIFNLMELLLFFNYFIIDIIIPAKSDFIFNLDNRLMFSFLFFRSRSNSTSLTTLAIAYL